MGRPPKFTNDLVLDGALRVVTASGPATVTIDSVAAELGGNVGSIYHRFPSKDALLALLWLRCARAGHQGFVTATRLDDVNEAVQACVLHYPRWSRKAPAEASVLAAFGREQLVSTWPDDLAAELATVNHELVAALDTLSRRRFGHPTRRQRAAMTTALLDVPAGAIRRYLLAGKPPPHALDELLVAGANAMLACVEPHRSNENPTNRITN
jgi:AcrR family transcriptional regulator